METAFNFNQNTPLTRTWYLHATQMCLDWLTVNDLRFQMICANNNAAHTVNRQTAVPLPSDLVSTTHCEICRQIERMPSASTPQDTSVETKQKLTMHTLMDRQPKTMPTIHLSATESEWVRFNGTSTQFRSLAPSLTRKAGTESPTVKESRRYINLANAINFA